MEKNTLPKRLARIYLFLAENSEIVPWSAVFEKHDEVRIWKGFGQSVADELDFNINAVYRYFHMLEVMGCIKKIRHGAATSPGIFQLLKEPKTSSYYDLKDRSLTTGLTSYTPTQSTRLQDSVNRLYNRVTELEKRMERIENDRNNF